MSARSTSTIDAQSASAAPASSLPVWCGSRRCCVRCTTSAAAPLPNSATEIAKNAKWYQTMTEKIRVSTSSVVISAMLSNATPSPTRIE